ncbi:hypothetical protein R6Q57_018285 [Mikania cordata]
MSWWDGDFFFGQYSDVSRVAETYQEPCIDEDVNKECYAGEQSHPPLVVVKEEEPEEEPDVIHQNMDWNTNEARSAREEGDGNALGLYTPWSRLFEMTFAPQYRLITMEFLSTFLFRPRAADQPQADLGMPLVCTPRRSYRCRSTRRLFIQLTMQSSAVGGLGSATSCFSELPGSRVYVTRSFVICTGSLSRLLQDVK